MVRISEAFDRMADRARLEGDPLPIIQTDIMSGMILLRAIERDLGMPQLSLSGHGPLGMYNGIAIISPKRRLVVRHEAAWLDHFGGLAEAFS